MRCLKYALKTFKCFKPFQKQFDFTFIRVDYWKTKTDYQGNHFHKSAHILQTHHSDNLDTSCRRCFHPCSPRTLQIPSCLCELPASSNSLPDYSQTSAHTFSKRKIIQLFRLHKIQAYRHTHHKLQTQKKPKNRHHQTLLIWINFVW